MNLFHYLAARKKLVDAFRLFSDHLPQIHSINHNSYVFTIPNGMNPKLLYDHLYVFKQVFGAKADLTGDHKRFSLTLNPVTLPNKLPYKLGDWQDVIAGLDLPVVLGVNQHGKKDAYDLSTQPHLLLSGETGSGKSSLLRAILTTLMLTKKPTELRFVLGDMKLSEFGIFRSIAHVDGVHFEASELERALMKVKRELNRRGELLAEAEVSHIKDLPEKLPYIIVAIDEVALLRDEKRIMAIVEDISSIGRSLGVLLLLSMQRPDAKVLDGRLKNNLTVRISGRQSNETNAKVAGCPGAEKIGLKEYGRMIYAGDEMQLIQAPWLAFDEAKRLLAPLKVKTNKKVKPSHVKPDVPIDLPIIPNPQSQDPVFTFGMLGGINDAAE